MTRATRMGRRLGLVAGASTLLAGGAAAQSLGGRVGAVRDGLVYVAIAPRPGICGDGAALVQAGRTTFQLPFAGRWRDGGSRDQCIEGPVRVQIGREDGRTVSLRTHVGGRWSEDARATNFGFVPSTDAARWLLGQARTLGGRSGEHALAAAVLADSVDLTGDLARLVRDGDVQRSTREAALFWLGALYDDAGRAILRSVVTDEALEPKLRAAAVIALGQDELEREDADLLRRAFPSAHRDVKNGILLVLSRSDDARDAAWFERIVSDDRESMDVRRSALFWMGQGNASLDALMRTYDRLDGRELRQHFTFVLSQRRERGAVDRLIEIARRDSDREVRRQAMFWLGQSKDERARAFLREVVTR